MFCVERSECATAFWKYIDWKRDLSTWWRQEWCHIRDRYAIASWANRNTGCCFKTSRRFAIQTVFLAVKLNRYGRSQGSFRVGTRGNTPSPLLKCLRTYYRRHWKPFSGQNALECRILHIQSQNFSGNVTPGPSQKRPRYLDPEPISAWRASIPIVPVLWNYHHGPKLRRILEKSLDYVQLGRTLTKFLSLGLT